MNAGETGKNRVSNIEAIPVSKRQFMALIQTFQLRPRYWQVKFLEPGKSRHSSSSNRPVPLIKRSDPEIPVILSPDQMPSQVEQVADRSRACPALSGMGTQKSLRLTCRFEPTHPSLPNSGRLVRLLCPIILILLSTVDRLGYQLPMCDAVTSQLVSHNLPGFTTM